MTVTDNLRFQGFTHILMRQGGPVVLMVMQNTIRESVTRGEPSTKLRCLLDNSLYQLRLVWKADLESGV